MRDHEQTNDRVPLRAWLRRVVVAVAALTAFPAPAQEPTEAPAEARSTDPVDVAADSIRAWSVGQERWLLLQGQVAIVQGLEGVRASAAVIRVTPDLVRGPDFQRLEIYAEGQAQPIGRLAPPLPSLRFTLQTQADVKLKPYDARAVIREQGPPRDVAILARAFPSPPPPRRANPAATRSPAQPPPAVEPPAAPRPAERRASSVPVKQTGRRADAAVARAQFEPEGFEGDPQAREPEQLPPAIEAPAMEDDDSPRSGRPPTTLEPLPGLGGPRTRALPGPDGEAPPPDQPPTIPIMPGTQRSTRITSRHGQTLLPKTLPDANGYRTLVYRGGITITTEAPPPVGLIDLSAESAIIWRRIENKETTLPDGRVVEDAGAPMEVYLEGDVIIRQDGRVVAGSGDNKAFRCERAFYDVRTGRFVGLDAQLDMFAPGLISPTKLYAPRIDQYRPIVPGPDGKLIYGMEEIRADKTVITGSRFPVPGYRFNSRSVGVTHVVSSHQNPNTGSSPGDPRDPNAPKDLTWRIDARQNVFFLGPVPVFYWPRFLGDADDLEPPLRQLRYGFNNYFGHQILADFNGFRLFGIRKPQWIDSWNIDIDYLSMRTKQFPAFGSEIGWFGRDFLADLTDPYRRRERNTDDQAPDGYFGYLDMWGLRDDGIDVLGSGPAVVTPNGRFVLSDGTPPGKAGFQRGASGIPGLPNGVPPFQKFRGRINMRHMQSFLNSDADPYEDFRVQLEAAYVSDRQFLEEYYKRLNETGLDQETLAYLIRQKENWAWSIWTEANLQNFNTETQWLPRLDYYRLGDSPFNNWFTYYQHTGVDYANTHTAVEVNNPNIFAFMPYDPISNTSGPFRSGRFYTNHELDLPLNFDNIVRVVPYVQGQAVGWDNQIDGNGLGRVWGAAGARADIMAWKRYPDAESHLFNVHGLNHKISFEADYRNAYSNVSLNQIGVQDDLDDNTYEFVRRYFALTQYIGGVLPPQYDPRHLILRRAITPITGTTDVQASMQTLQLNIHSRLQTQRGPEGRRRIMDWMTLDLSSTYFPYATRDNFGKSFGQNMYNWQWFIGDRTSIISYGWFEFFDITGKPTNKATTHLVNDPFGLNVITSGISISRPPRGNVFIGYTILDSGQVTTSALNPSISYWMSPKWYGTFSTSYDFGNAIWLSSMFSFTRVGADYLLTIGLVVDPQRQNYSQIAVAISPRLSPGIRFGSGTGTNQFDSRYAPTQ